MSVADSDSHVFASTLGRHVFLTERSQIFDVGEGALYPVAGRGAPARLPLHWPELRPARAVSLNLAQACNLSCGYCYAAGGTFGGASRLMTLEVATATIDRLLADADPGAPLLVGFMGGEPLLNRPVLHEAVRYAAAAAARTGHAVRFSLTTNATLLSDADAALFCAHPFAVQVSLDGDRATHDRQRPARRGGGSYDAAVAGVGRLLRHGRPTALSGRMTVTPGRHDDMLARVAHLLGLGFDDVGLAPVLVSPDPAQQFGPDDFAPLLDAVIACGRKAMAEALAGRRWAFTNFETAMAELHRGSHRPLPCGAAAGYMSASAEGTLFACHRLVDEPSARLGDVRGGVDAAARAAFLTRGHVDAIPGCSSCWARYLCGGGCHHEVARRGRTGCDFIRGWLDFCLSAYVELSERAPWYFSGPHAA